MVNFENFEDTNELDIFNAYTDEDLEEEEGEALVDEVDEDEMTPDAAYNDDDYEDW